MLSIMINISVYKNVCFEAWRVDNWNDAVAILHHVVAMVNILHRGEVEENTPPPVEWNCVKNA